MNLSVSKNQFFSTSIHFQLSEILIALVIAIAAITCVYLINYLFHFIIPKSTPKPLNTILRVARRVIKALILFSALLVIVNRLSNKDLMSADNIYYNLILSIVLIGFSTVILASISRALFTNLIESMERKEKDITKYAFLRAVIEALIYFLGIMAVFLSIPGMQNYAKTILGGAGILALIAGFAAQETVSNVLAGIFIIFSKPFKIGDTIKIADNMMGTVWDISLRHTIIKDYDNKMIVVPNAIINKEKIFNYSLGDARACERIEFTIDFTANIDLARKIMEEEVEAHPLSIDPRNPYERDTGIPRVVTKVVSLSDSGVIVRVWAWSSIFDHAYTMRCDLIDSIKKRFDQAGIQIPYPHRTVVMKTSSDNKPPIH